MVLSPIKPGKNLRLHSGAARRAPDQISHWCVRFQDLCRARGIRVTAQRLAVYRALAEDTTHPTADSLHERLRANMSTLSPATVYRILEFLEREGLVHRVSTTEGAARFDANAADHRHLVCRACGRIADYEEELPEKIRLPRRAPGGFVAEELDIRIIGLCSGCQAE